MSSNMNNAEARDHCACPECRHPDTKQRLVDTFSVRREFLLALITSVERVIFYLGKHVAANTPIKIPESITARGIEQEENGIFMTCE